MHFYQNERLALFIDGADLYATARALDFDLDYKRLLMLFQQRGRMVRAIYFRTLIEDADGSPFRPLIDWLTYNGFSVVTKPVKERIDASKGGRLTGAMEVELAVHAMQLAEGLDHIVLFSGNGDLRSLVAALQQLGKP
jgi:uncharacterized LabA/DUF88 family protein